MARIMTIMAARRQPYKLAFAEVVTIHLRSSDVKHHTAIHRKIGEQLRYAPGTETINRKPLKKPAAFGATWEIRFGPANCFRVLYDLDEEARTVRILAIGEKRQERLVIGGEEVQL